MSDYYKLLPRLYKNTPARIALAPRYRSLEAAWADMHPGSVIINDAGQIVAFHEDAAPWIAHHDTTDISAYA